MASTKGAEMVTLLTLPCKWTFSTVVKTPVLYNILGTSITPFDVGGISLLESGGGLPIDDKFPNLSLDCAMKLAVGRVILECVEHVVEVNEGSLMATISTLSNLKIALGTSHPVQLNVPSNLCHCVLGTRLSLHEKIQLSLEWGEEQRVHFVPFILLLRLKFEC